MLEQEEVQPMAVVALHLVKKALDLVVEVLPVVVQVLMSLLVLVGLVAAGVGILLPPSPYNSLYQALALEQFVLLAIVFLIVSGVPRWAARQLGTLR